MRSSLFIATLIGLFACTGDSALEPEREPLFGSETAAFSSTTTDTKVEVVVKGSGERVDVYVSWQSTGASEYLVYIRAGRMEAYNVVSTTRKSLMAATGSTAQASRACVSAKDPRGGGYLQPSCTDWTLPGRDDADGGGEDGSGDGGGDDDGKDGGDPVGDGPDVSAGSWPNEPAGFTRVLDDGFETCRAGSPWSGWDAQTVVERAPGSVLGENCAVRQKYTLGQEGGSGNEVFFDVHHRNFKEVYFAFWLRLDEKWQGHDSFINKLASIRTSFKAEWPGGNDQGTLWIEAHGVDNGPLEMAAVPQMYGGCGTANWHDRPDTPVRRGKWHLVETVVKMARTRTSNDGSLQIWLDGKPVVTRHNLCTTGRDEGSILAVSLSGMWGGRWDSLQNPDQGMWYDRVRVSAR